MNYLTPTKASSKFTDDAIRLVGVGGCGGDVRCPGGCGVVAVQLSMALLDQCRIRLLCQWWRLLPGENVGALPQRECVSVWGVAAARRVLGVVRQQAFRLLVGWALDTEKVLIELAELGPQRCGAKLWEPPAELVEAILAARRNHASYNSIAEALQKNGVSASFGAVRRWLQLRGL